MIAEKPFTPPSYALAYGRKGWRVHPLHNLDAGICTCGGGAGCQTPAKHPRLSGWQKQATTDEGIIKRWWRQHPTANVGIVTGAGSGIVVLDVDPRNGGDESLAELERQCGPLPETPTVLTGGGGVHYYFAHPGGYVESRTGEKGTAPGLELVADGGHQVVASPSFAHRDGRAYRWDVGRHIADIALAPLPDWLLAMAPGNRKNGKVANLPDRISEGEHNAALASFAGGMRARGASESEVFHAAQAVNMTRCDPPLSEQEVRKIAASIGRYEPRAPSPSRFPGPTPRRRPRSTGWRGILYGLSNHILRPTLWPCWCRRSPISGT